MENIIKELRAERGLTQEALAYELKVSRQTINAIEKGKYDASLELAFKMSEFFGKRIEEIFVHKKED